MIVEAWAVGTWGFILSLVAILGAGASVVYTRRQAIETREQARHAKTVADIETARRVDEVADRQRSERALALADVTVTNHAESVGMLIVQNRGPAMATAVSLDDDGTPGRFLLNPPSDVRLASGSTIEVQCVRAITTVGPPTVTLRWSDGEGTHVVNIDIHQRSKKRGGTGW